MTIRTNDETDLSVCVLSESLCSSFKSLTAQLDSDCCHIWDFLHLLVMFYQLPDVSNYSITTDSKQRLIHVDVEMLNGHFAIARADLF